MTNPKLLLIGNFLSQHVGTRCVGEDLAERLTGAGYPVITTSSNMGRVSRLIDMGQTILRRKNEYDAAYVEVYSGLAFVWAELCAALLSHLHKPFILALHGGGLPGFSRKNPLRIRKLLSRASTVVTPSFFIQKNLSPFYAQIQYLPNALDISRYSFRLREQVAPKLIWLRAFHRIYHPELAVEILAEVVKSAPDATLTMIGPDKHDGSMERTLERVRDFRLQEKVMVKGFIPKCNVPTELNQGDIFINTTRFESFGVSVMEAAACGLPVVTTMVGELEYLWKDGENALLVAVDDCGAMATAVLRILNESGLAGRLSFNAHSKAAQYDWAIILPKWKQIIQGLLIE